MIDVFTCFLIAMLFTGLVLWAYRRGLKDGMGLKDNKPIEPIKTPVQVIIDAKEAKAAKQESDKVTQGLVNLLNFDGNPQAKDE